MEITGGPQRLPEAVRGHQRLSERYVQAENTKGELHFFLISRG